MATRLKTIEYAFGVNIATLATATRRDLTAITIYIPESSPVFKSVVVESFWADDITAAASVTAILVGIKLGSVAFSDATVTDTITNSGEAQSYFHTRDVTSYFTANWTGTSMACQVGMTVTGTASQNHSAKIYITYEFDDSASTQIKTIRIPIESTLASVGTTYANLGGSTPIPAIGGAYLPEATATVRQVWLELFSGDSCGGTTDWISYVSINGGADVAFWDCEAALNSARTHWSVLDITALDLSAARSLQAKTVGVGGRHAHLGGMIYVTYEFAPGSTDTVYNSLILGIGDMPGGLGSSTAANGEVLTTQINIQETGSLTLKESAVVLFLQDPGSPVLNVAVGAQSNKSYTQLAVLSCEQKSLVHRIDSGGVNGAFATIQRGSNDLAVKLYSNTAGTVFGINGYCILNYTSGKSTDVNNNAHSVYHHLIDYAADDTIRESASTAPAIPEANYGLVGAVMRMVGTLFSPNLGGGVVVSGKFASGEPEITASIWNAIARSIYRNEGENVGVSYMLDAAGAFRNCSGDRRRNRMNIETARVYRFESSTGFWGGLGLWLTYNNFTYTLSGNISGAAGSGDITINLHKSANDEKFMTQAVAYNAASYSFTIPNDLEELYAVAYQDATHMGISEKDTVT